MCKSLGNLRSIRRPVGFLLLVPGYIYRRWDTGQGLKHTLAVVIDEPLSLVVQGEGRSERQPSPSSDKGQTSEIEGIS